MTAPEQDRRADEGGGASEALRSAIERTFAATAGSAAETREKAGELLDDVARRGQEAREEVARRGHEAREEVARRGLEARRGIGERLTGVVARLRGGEEADRERELERLRRRVSELERELKSKSKHKG